jgi:TRAP-type transport system periplasmic protein
MRKTLTLAATVAVTMAASGLMAQTYQLKAIGQPVATGLIQKNIEQPFFENFAERTGIDATVDYKPLDVTGIKDTEELRILKSRLVDIVSLRLSQVSRDEPTILGLDLVGLNPDYATGRITAAAYKDLVDEQLQKKFNTKLLGVWPFGPQVLFCDSEITKLSDLKGKKVRVYDQNLANFVSSVGGTPVPIGFADVHQSLARGVVDCAITGPSSANSAGWPEVTKYMLPVAFQLAMNGYGINLDAFNEMTPEDQKKLEAGFDTLIEEIWTYSESLFDDAVRCNVGAEPCETGKKFNLKLVPITDQDRAIIGNAVQEISFPTWAKICDAQNDSCSADWSASVGAALKQ